MSKFFRLIDKRRRDNCCSAVRLAPDGWEVVIREAKRNSDQNKAFWAAMAELSRHATFAGQKWSDEDWRTLILSGLKRAAGERVTVIEGLEGEPVALGLSSAALTKSAMSAALDYAHAKLAELAMEDA